MDYIYDKPLYKKMNGNVFDTTRTQSCWFGLSPDILDTYGKNLFTLQSNRPLKLLNIMSWKFRHDFMDKLNLYFGGSDIQDDSKRIKKSYCMMALGTYDINNQYELMRKYIMPLPLPKNDPYMTSDTITLPGHRFSEKTIDMVMIQIIKDIYDNEFDGYIQPYRVASIWMNAFPPEIGLFNISKCQLNIVQPGGKKKKSKKVIQKGGVVDPHIEDDVWYHKMNDTMFDPDTFLSDYNVDLILLLREDGYTNEEIIKMEDKDGYIQMPSFKERDDKRFYTPTSQKISDEERKILHSHMKIMQIDKIILPKSSRYNQP